ncbi:L-rhamnose mutarotase [Chitinophaga sp. G-6-1-13]|uniref:L-rhamnose mutarotase n=1 Tax=Chitinophaga fulva TaxID=2728842 RepID=A0A848GND9_9BACT|nr:L-rhamnose mutarotase [Chitinophaga fulva]NML39986.1 L-rhamnose mutarotase [Chitinophaga fulva]
MMNKILLVFFAIAMVACGSHKAVKTEEKVFVVNIVPEEKKLQEYLRYHQQVWPEVEAGFKKAGYQKITLYRYKYLLVMKIEVPAGADLQQMGKTAEAYSPRCAEWNRLMGGYQVGVPGTGQGETWVEATPFYEFRKE